RARCRALRASILATIGTADKALATTVPTVPTSDDLRVLRRCESSLEGHLRAAEGAIATARASSWKADVSASLTGFAGSITLPEGKAACKHAGGVARKASRAQPTRDLERRSARMIDVVADLEDDGERAEFIERLATVAAMPSAEQSDAFSIL